MDAPKTGVTAQSGGNTPFTPTGRRGGQIMAVSAVLIALSAIAYVQMAADYRWHEPYAAFRPSWWFHPIEWNVDAALPEVVGRINAVEVISNRVFVAGDVGLIAMSEDDGRTWTQLAFDPASREFRVPGAQPPAAAKAKASLDASGLIGLFVPTVYAQVTGGNAAQQKAPLSSGSTPVQAKPPSSPEDIKVSKDVVSFGQVRVGESKSIELEFLNTKPEPLLVGRPFITKNESGGFAIGGSSCTQPTVLNAYEGCKFSVVFDPKDMGKVEATLEYAAHFIPLRAEAVGEKTPPDKNTLNTAPPTTKPSTPTPSQSTPSSAQQTSTPPPSLAQAPDLGAFGYCAPQNCELLGIRVEDPGLASKDGGLTWEPATSFEGTSLHGDVVAALSKRAGFIRDATRDAARNRFWVVRVGGGLFRVESDQWIPVMRTAAATLPGHAPVDAATQYGRSVPPWYPVILLASGLLLVIEPRRRKADEPVAPEQDILQVRAIDFVRNERNSKRGSAPSVQSPDQIVREDSAIGNQGTADKPLSPGEPDALGLGIIATGLDFFLRNERTKPPLVLAINGRWGSGKSSLMNLLKSRLEEYGAQPVWFNAWHHQQEDQLLAALLEAVKTQAIPPLSRAAGWDFRLRLAWMRLQRSWVQLALVLGAVVLVWQVELHLREKGLSLGQGLSSLVTWSRSDSTTVAAERAKAAVDAAQKLQEAAAKNTDPARVASLNTEAARFLSIAAQPVTETAFDVAMRWVQNSSLLALLTALAAGFKTLSGGLRAFASKPASLLASDSGSTAPRDLEAQTSFRQRFAAEFADVTGALGGNRRMMILIDDLDRCRPEKVREVLEAVNFLCSSGECFVVLGMARNIVEHCVGLSFRHVVDTMAWDAFDMAPEEIERFVEKARASASTSSRTVPIEEEAKRLAFARLFLDKLIQIEVSIPEPTPVQKKKLFETDEERKSKEAVDVRVTKWLGISRATMNAIVPVTKAAVVLIIVMGLGMQIGRALAPALDGLMLPLEQPAAVAQPAQTSTPVGPQPASTPPLPDRPLPQILAGTSVNSSGWLARWPFLAAALFVLAALSFSLRRLPHQSVVDAKPFTNALAIWHPLVMTSGARNTPRTARRFQNRVRYLAMRQRAAVFGAPIPRLEGWVRAMFSAPATQPEPLLVLPSNVSVLEHYDRDLGQIGEWLTRGIEGTCALASVNQTAEGTQIEVHQDAIGENGVRALATGQVRIPEPILVALAAIDELSPAWIDDADIFRMVISAKRDKVTDPNEAALADAIKRHIDGRNSWENLTHYRRAYLRLCSEIDHTKSPAARPPTAAV